MMVPFDALIAGPDALQRICARLGLTLHAAMVTSLQTVPAGHANAKPRDAAAATGLSARFSPRVRRLTAG
jgi:precorrin-6B methylase 1